MKRWFIWWISRMSFENGKWIDRGAWFGPQNITDYEAWKLEIQISKTSGARPYRMMWDGYEWIYDSRNGVAMTAGASGSRAV